MNALSIRNRFEYALIGTAVILACGWLAFHMVKTEGDSAGFAALLLGLFGIGIGRQFIFFPPNTSLQRWWWNKTSLGYYGIPWTGGAIRIIRANGPKSNIIFDLDGNCVGDEDYILGQWHFHHADYRLLANQTSATSQCALSYGINPCGGSVPRLTASMRSKEWLTKNQSSMSSITISLLSPLADPLCSG
jgi:hypothetical protein